ncbi:MAG TPA: cytochrome c biogenesis protein ResB, partial [Nitrospirae bacterium]|nr:cytochrome c biogenesis protein ResB [Nitrospirota bacterium]
MAKYTGLLLVRCAGRYAGRPADYVKYCPEDNNLEDKKQKDVFDRIWDFFAAVKLAVVLLIILALSSIVGTIVEQRAEPATNIALLAKFFGDSFAPTVYNIFVNLGFMDMYHSWWFVSILVMLSVNLTVCSLERLPKTVRLINTPMRPLGEKVIRTLAVRNELAVTSSLKVVKDEVLNILNSLNYRVLEATEENSVQLYSQKGKYTRLGVYVVHVSILLIFAGAIIGSQFGFRGSLNLPEGDYSDVAYSSKGNPIPLGFIIKCNWYNTEYYGESSTPRAFQSELVVIENGKEILKKVIKVNHPLTYRGITFYQSSYGVLRGVLDEFIVQDTPSGGRMSTLQPTFSRFPNSIGRFILTVTPANGQPNTLALRRGDIFNIPGTDIS